MNTAEQFNPGYYADMSALELGKEQKLIEHRIDVLLRERTFLATLFDMLQRAYFEYGTRPNSVVSGTLLAKTGTNIQKRQAECETALSEARSHYKLCCGELRKKNNWVGLKPR